MRVQLLEPTRQYPPAQLVQAAELLSQVRQFESEQAVKAFPGLQPSPAAIELVRVQVVEPTRQYPLLQVEQAA